MFWFLKFWQLFITLNIYVSSGDPWESLRVSGRQLCGSRYGHVRFCVVVCGCVSFSHALITFVYSLHNGSAIWKNFLEENQNDNLGKMIKKLQNFWLKVLHLHWGKLKPEIFPVYWEMRCFCWLYYCCVSINQFWIKLSTTLNIANANWIWDESLINKRGYCGSWSEISSCRAISIQRLFQACSCTIPQ